MSGPSGANVVRSPPPKVTRRRCGATSSTATTEVTKVRSTPISAMISSALVWPASPEAVRAAATMANSSPVTASASGTGWGNSTRPTSSPEGPSTR